MKVREGLAEFIQEVHSGLNPGLYGERSVVSSDDVTKVGEQSGELGDVSSLRCSTCYHVGQTLYGVQKV